MILPISPIQEIKEALLDAQNIRLFLKRDDQLHPSVSGNKWRKLKYNIQQAKAFGQTTLLTFGGAFSNHIYAVAAAGKVFGFKTIGIIRGERMEPLNATLQFAEEHGMHLHFVSRTAYREKNTLAFQEELKQVFGDFYLLPEGGTNELALKGCAEIVEELRTQLPTAPDYICTCCGTGGTMAGIIQGSAAMPTKVIGVAALKGDFLTKEVQWLLSKTATPHASNWLINNDYHFGGYAKFKPSLVTFINEFYDRHQIPLDPIYTGKLLFGIFDLLKKGFFERGSTVVAIHTGGLQGIRGFNERYGDLIKYANFLKEKPEKINSPS